MEELPVVVLLLLLLSLLLVPLVLLDRRRRGRLTPPFSVLVVAGSGEWGLLPAGAGGAVELPLRAPGTTSPGMQREERLALRCRYALVHAGSCSRVRVPGARVPSGPPPAFGCFGSGFELLFRLSPKSRTKAAISWCRTEQCSCPVL